MLYIKMKYDDLLSYMFYMRFIFATVDEIKIGKSGRLNCSFYMMMGFFSFYMQATLHFFFLSSMLARDRLVIDTS
jgi:hypothetical protein